MFFAMVKHASKIDLKWDIEHKKYNTPKGKLEESFHLGKHCTWIDSTGPLLGAYPVEGLGAPGASSSQAPPPTQSFGQLPKEGPSHFCGAPKKMLMVYFGTPSMFITLWFGFDYGTNPPLGTPII
jgi:hypothetical protein